MGYDREELLAVAKGSPAAVAAGDRDTWMGLFAKYNIVEDPIGSRPHVSGTFDSRTGRRGAGPLGRFYDTFIAPNDITFHVKNDVVAGMTVARELEIELVMSTGVRAHVPMHLFYELVEDDGELKIWRLAAHWELLPMILQVLRQGVAGARSMILLGNRMLKIQGIGGALGFMTGFRGIGARGKEIIEDFERAVNARNNAWLFSLFRSGQSQIHFPVGEEPVSAPSVLQAIDTEIKLSNPLTAGYSTTCTIEFEHAGVWVRGLALFEFNAKSRRIETAKFYWEPSR